MGKSKKSAKSAPETIEKSAKQKIDRTAPGKKNSEAKAAKSADKKRTGAQPSGGLGAKMRQLREFFEESKVELKKVTWPSRKETIATSVAVLVLTVVMAIYLGIVDFALSNLVQFILT